MSAPIVLDLETKHTFQEVGFDHRKLGISMVGIYDYGRNVFEAYFENDLNKLFPLLESASLIIGFNIRKFDFPVLAPYYVGQIDNLPLLDLLEDVEKAMGFRLALDVLAKETLGAQKNGHGLLAIEYYRTGNLEKLKEYCLSDVRITRDLYEWGKKQGKVYFKDAKGRREIPVQWNKIGLSQSNIPLTLPL